MAVKSFVAYEPPPTALYWTGVDVLKTFFIVVNLKAQQAWAFVPGKELQSGLIFALVEQLDHAWKTCQGQTL